MKARLFPWQCCYSMYGISILTPRPTSLTSTSDASAEKSTVSRPIRSSIPSAASGFVSVLLAKTLRSSTFKWALIWITIFGAVVIALFSYVYWSTAAYVHGRSDRAIAAEQIILQKAYASTGRGGLIAAIEDRIANRRFESGIYMLAEPSFAPLAGNLKAWPSTLKGSKGLQDFAAREWKPDAANPPMLRAMFDTLPNGDHLLVGKEIDDLDEFAKKIKTALLWGVALAIGNHEGTPIASLGIVTIAGPAWHSLRGGTIDSLIRLDLALSPAAEGGAVVDVQGRVVGMAVLGPRRRALAIPTSTIDRVVDQLLAKGHVFRGYLGAGLQPVRLGRPSNDAQPSGTGRRGILLASIDPDGPAARAGLLVGDIVTTWNSKPVDRVREVMRLLGSDSIGNTVDLGLLRGGAPTTLKVVIGERPVA